MARSFSREVLNNLHANKFKNIVADVKLIKCNDKLLDADKDYQ